MKIGIIGLGDMGKMFARIWSAKSFEVYGCDLPENREKLTEELADTNIRILDDGVAISRLCDFIIYAVEAEKIEQVVKAFGPSTKFGAIVSGQTSVKSPEIEAFNKYLPSDTQIVGSHALYGPNVNPEGQTIVVFNHRATPEAFQEAIEVYQALGSVIEVLESHAEHDKMMADIQVVTHIGFESIGTAFMHRKVFPWENGELNHGMDNIKLLLTLRIFSYKHHVYSGLAMLNPFAKTDVRKYAKAENELFGMMITENKNKLRSRVLKARDKVFRDKKSILMLDDTFMNEYSLNNKFIHKPNSHLSLLSMVCTWSDLNTNPYKNLVCQTPPFKLRVGLSEYLFLNDDLLEESLNAALYDKSILEDDLAFHTAVHEWANIVEIGDKKSYEKHFEATKHFLSPRLEEGRAKSNELIERLNQLNK
jgi:prephenate dehydrogenase (NADP+)